MDESGPFLAGLGDAEVAGYALRAEAVWLWACDGSYVLWANPAAVAITDPVMPPEDAPGGPARGSTPAAQIARCAATLAPNAPARLERLRGFAIGFGRALTCLCSRVTLADGQEAVLVVATELTGPRLSLGERAQQLLAGTTRPAAIFATDGRLLHANDEAVAILGTAVTLQDFGAGALAKDAVAKGGARGQIAGTSVELKRIGAGETTGLLAFLAAGPTSAAPAPQRHAPDAIRPSVSISPGEDRERAGGHGSSPAERYNYPLRFVWRIDSEGHFVVESQAFLDLIGPKAAAALGQPWPAVAAALALDPAGAVGKAIGSRNTWSGIKVHWPVNGSEASLEVELSGLPVFDADRGFQGYRGFGICRDLARLNALAASRGAARRSGQARASESVAEKAETPAGTVRDERLPPLAPARPLQSPTLNALERRAFRELARQLTSRLNERGIPTATKSSEPDEFARAPEPGTPLTRAPTPPSQREAPPAVRPPHAEAARPAEPRPDQPPAPAHQQQVLDQLPFGVLVYRHDDLIYANEAFLTATGFATLDALLEAGGIGSLTVEPQPRLAGDRDSQFLQITSGGAGPVTLEGRLSTTSWDGEPASLLVLAPSGSVASAAATTPSTTERSAEDEARELHAILDTATDGVVIVNGEGRILSANRSAQALFGYDSHELSGRMLIDLFAPESRLAALDYLDGLSRSGVASLLNDGREVIGRVREGGLIPLFMTMGRIADETQKFCAVFRDITQWKKAEEELLSAKREAEKASSAKSDFLAKISHEIRTPLNAIIGFSEVMMDERFGSIGNERYREYLKDIHTSGEHLISLLNDLLDLSKIEAGRLDLNFTSVNLNDLTQQCVAIMQPQANQQRIIIRTSLAPKLPQVVADARSVRQIILNLLSNSIKFTGAGGQVIVSTALNDDGEVAVRVRDTGVGMNESEIQTALEPFRQLATSSRWGSFGTGLGLPLTKALAEANRASFNIKSAPNDGTLVEVVFPVTRVLAE